MRFCQRMAAYFNISLTFGESRYIFSVGCDLKISLTSRRHEEIGKCCFVQEMKLSRIHREKQGRHLVSENILIRVFNLPNMV